MARPQNPACIPHMSFNRILSKSHWCLRLNHCIRGKALIRGMRPSKRLSVYLVLSFSMHIPMEAVNGPLILCMPCPLLGTFLICSIPQGNVFSMNADSPWFSARKSKVLESRLRKFQEVKYLLIHCIHITRMHFHRGRILAKLSWRHAVKPSPTGLQKVVRILYAIRTFLELSECTSSAPFYIFCITPFSILNCIRGRHLGVDVRLPPTFTFIQFFKGKNFSTWWKHILVSWE